MSLRRRNPAELAALGRKTRYGAHVEGLLEVIAIPAGYEGRLRRMVELSVKVPSNYESLLHSCLDTRGYARTQMGLLCFILDGPYPKKAPATVANLRSALRWHCKRENQYLHPWLDELIDVCVKGYHGAHTTAGLTRHTYTGAVTAAMMEDLLVYLEVQKAAPWVRDGIVLQWAFCLRGGQVLGVQLRNLARVGGEWTVTLPRDKTTYTEDMNARHQCQHETHRIIPVQRARDTVDRLVAELQARGAAENTRLIEKYPDTTVNRLIKAAAAYYGWGNEFVVFRGRHSMRHGGATEARLYLERNKPGAGEPGAEGYDDVCEETRLVYTCHRSKVVKQYIMTNEERNLSGLAWKQRDEMFRARNKTTAVNPKEAEQHVERDLGLEFAKILAEAEHIAGKTSTLGEMFESILKEAEYLAGENQHKHDDEHTCAGGGATAGPAKLQQAKPKAKRAAREKAPRQAGTRRQRPEDEDE